MKEDYKATFRISLKATDIATKVVEDGRFSNGLNFLRFAFAYAVKNYFNEIKPENLDDTYDSDGSTYNLGSIDQDGFMVKLIYLLYPECKTPYRYIRVLMIYGAERLGELLDKGMLFPINKNM